jgi:hypothetical protein
MSSTFLIAVTLAAAPAVAATPAASGAHVAATGKSLDAFARCFVQTQERASRPWWFVPKADGGTFSNFGSKDAQGTYFARLQETERQVNVELDASAPLIGATIRAAIDRCI